MPVHPAPDDIQPTPRPSEWASIIKAITTPLHLFALVFLASVVALGVGGNSLALWLMIVTVLCFAFLLWRRPEVLTPNRGQIDGMVHAIGTDICEALRPYLNDIESKKTRREAFETLIALIGNPEDRANLRVRTELARVIRARLRALGDLDDDP